MSANDSEDFDLTVTGFDVSLNHGAAVTLSTKEGRKYDFFTDKKTHAKKPGGSWLPRRRDASPEQMAIERLMWISGWVYEVIFRRAPDYVGIEGYAFSRANQAHQLGEVGGLVRTGLFYLQRPFRIHDPTSVKLFATGKGDADKAAIVSSIAPSWAILESNLDGRTVEDLADAYTIASMVDLEVRLRHGLASLHDLDEHKIRVFNRVTKAYPQNILDRDWIWYNQFDVNAHVAGSEK